MKAGDKVRMSEAGRAKYKDDWRLNPHFATGILREGTSEGWPYQVFWETGGYNEYRLGEIEAFE
jgi:hypothetical protein